VIAHKMDEFMADRPEDYEPFRYSINGLARALEAAMGVSDEVLSREGLKRTKAATTSLTAALSTTAGTPKKESD
jgi:hypothetical protein